VIDHGDARGVIATVFKAGEALEGDVHRTGGGGLGARACISDDSTHAVHASDGTVRSRPRERIDASPSSRSGGSAHGPAGPAAGSVANEHWMVREPDRIGVCGPLGGEPGEVAGGVSRDLEESP